MNTVKLKIKHGSIGSALKDIRRWRIRHEPFRRVMDGLEMDLYPNPKIDFLLLKYGNDVTINTR